MEPLAALLSEGLWRRLSMATRVIGPERKIRRKALHDRRRHAASFRFRKQIGPDCKKACGSRCSQHPKCSRTGDTTCSSHRRTSARGDNSQAQQELDAITSHIREEATNVPISSGQFLS